MAIRNFQRLFQIHLPEATQLHHIPGGLLQNIMDIGAKLRRIYGRFLPLLGPQAVLQEIGQAAFCLPVHLGGGQQQAFTVQSGNIFGSNRAKLELNGLLHTVKYIFDPQVPGACPVLHSSSRIKTVAGGIAHRFIRHIFRRSGLLYPSVYKRGLITANQMDRLLCTAEHTKDFGKFRLQAFQTAAGQRYADLAQCIAFLIRQQSGAAGISGKCPFIGTQYDQMLCPVAAHGTDITGRYRIQHRRDCADIILAQHQRQQTQKILILPGRVAQHIIHLLQCLQQNFPELIADLGAAAVALGFLRLGQSLQTLRKLNIQ